jgi:ribonuclease Z
MTLLELKAGPYTIRGVSVGGVCTSLQVPELDLLLDVGIPFRHAAGVKTLLLSHGHADHVGALNTLLGIRALHGITMPLRVVMPAEIVDTVKAALGSLSELQRWPLPIEAVGLEAGQEVPLKKDHWIRAFRTFHPVPSLGYQVVRRTRKLRAEFAGLSGEVIAARRRAGEEMLEEVEHLELAYATDTLVQVLDHEPSILTSKVLILECTFLDARKSLDAARAGCHVHLDELLERVDRFENQHLVLMHFSQLYRPDEVVPILDTRVPGRLRERIVAFAPAAGDWW